MRPGTLSITSPPTSLMKPLSLYVAIVSGIHASRYWTTASGSLTADGGGVAAAAADSAGVEAGRCAWPCELPDSGTERDGVISRGPDVSDWRRRGDGVFIGAATPLSASS